MANVAFDTLYDQILPYLPGAETPIVDLQIRKVVREFLKRTTLVRERFDFNTTIGSPTYQFNPTYGEVSSMLRVWWIDSNGKESELPVAPEDSRDWFATPGRPTSWFTVVPHLMTLQPSPNDVYQISCQAVITMSQTDTLIPEDVVRQYAEAIAAGVLASMFGMPGKPWTQSQSAKESGRIFSGMIKTIRGQLRDGGQPNQSTFRGIARFGA